MRATKKKLMELLFDLRVEQINNAKLLDDEATQNQRIFNLEIAVERLEKQLKARPLSDSSPKTKKPKNGINPDHEPLGDHNIRSINNHVCSCGHHDG